MHANQGRSDGASVKSYLFLKSSVFRDCEIDPSQNGRLAAILDF